MMLTAERLRELLAYDPDTGSFVWKKRTSNRTVIGKPITCQDRHGYIVVRVDCRMYRAHRLAFLYMSGCFPPHDVDHVSGDRSDNRWSNLREATRQENLRNKAGVKGVSLTPNNRWRAQISVSRRNIHLGCFHSADEARSAYEQAARKYFGEFAYIEREP